MRKFEKSEHKTNLVLKFSVIGRRKATFITFCQTVLKKEVCKHKGEKFVKKILTKKVMLQELNEFENGKAKRRNPKVIVDNEREKRYLEIIIME